MTFQFFSQNGKILPIDQAMISVFNLEYAYGFGVYENIRVQDLLPYFLDYHLERLCSSANSIGLYHTFTLQQLQRSVAELVNAIASSTVPAEAGPGSPSAALTHETDEHVSTLVPQNFPTVEPTSHTYNLKILLIGAREPSAAQLYILPLSPLFTDRKLYRTGAMVEAVYYERLFPEAKTLNMLPSYYYYTRGKQEGNYDVLFVDREGNVLEGSRTNFFAVKNKTIYTAPSEKILEGVTKKMVLKVARENGFEVVEQDIPLKSLQEYDGAFLTSTSSKIVPLTTIVSSTVIPTVVEESLSQRSSDPSTPAPPPLGMTVEYPTIAPAIKDLMKYFDEFLEEYRTVSLSSKERDKG